MAGILNKLMDFIGIEDVDDEGYNEDYFNDEQQSMAEDNVVSLGNRGRRKTAASALRTCRGVMCVPFISSRSKSHAWPEKFRSSVRRTDRRDRGGGWRCG